MPKNVVGLFENSGDAQAAVRDLESAGFSRSDVGVLQNSSRQVGGTLEQLGIPQDDAAIYQEGIRNGGAMVILQQLGDDDAYRAAEILDRHNIVDINDRERSFRGTAGSTATTGGTTERPTAMGSASTTGGGTSYGTRGTETVGTSSGTGSMGSGATSRRNLYEGGEQVIPIVEEEVRVGKQAVEGGGVRVNTRVEERPVEEQVSLRDEEVRVERRRVDQPVDAATVEDAFREGSFEVRERDEQPVVEKQARVVEEVVVNKDVQQRTEQIRDTARRTDVDVEEIPGQMRTTDTTRSSTEGVTGRTSGSTHGTSRTEGGDEGAIERGASKAENAVERGTGLDLDRDGDVGRRDPRNNVGGV